MSEKKQAAAQAAKAGAVIYLGPEIPGVISAGMVLNNGLTPQMEKAVKELPALKMLLVPVKEAAKVRKELKNEVSAVTVCYKKAVEYAAQKGVKG